MISLIDLKPPFNTLHSAKENRKRQDHSSNPESIPLHALSPVVPPLRYRAWFSLVKDLLQNHKPVMPERKILDLPVGRFQVPASDRLHVKR